MNPDTLNPGDTLTLNGDTYIVESLERTTHIGKDDDTLETQTIKVTLTNWYRAFSTHKQTYQVTQHNTTNKGKRHLSH